MDGLVERVFQTGRNLRTLDGVMDEMTSLKWLLEERQDGGFLL